MWLKKYFALFNPHFSHFHIWETKGKRQKNIPTCQACAHHCLGAWINDHTHLMVNGLVWGFNLCIAIWPIHDIAPSSINSLQLNRTNWMLYRNCLIAGDSWSSGRDRQTELRIARVCISFCATWGTRGQAICWILGVELTRLERCGWIPRGSQILGSFQTPLKIWRKKKRTYGPDSQKNTHSLCTWFLDFWSASVDLPGLGKSEVKVR